MDYTINQDDRTAESFVIILKLREAYKELYDSFERIGGFNHYKDFRDRRDEEFFSSPKMVEWFKEADDLMKFLVEQVPGGVGLMFLTIIANPISGNILPIFPKDIPYYKEWFKQYHTTINKQS